MTYRMNCMLVNLHYMREILKSGVFLKEVTATVYI